MRKLILALLLLFFGSVAASADPYKAMFLEALSHDVAPTDSDSVRDFERFGRCVSKNMDTQHHLEDFPLSQNDARTLFGLAFYAYDCHQTEKLILLSHLYLRGIIAEQFFMNDFGRATISKKLAGVRLFKRPSNAKLDSLQPEVRSAIIFVEVGECVAAASPEKTKALFLSNVRTEQEKAAFADLVPILADCVPPKVELKVAPSQFRGYLAEGAYRVAARNSGVVPGMEAAR